MPCSWVRCCQAVWPRLCSQRDRALIWVDFREPPSGGIASDSCGSVDRYRLQQSAQWIETLHKGVFVLGVQDLSLSFCTYLTGAVKGDEQDAAARRGRSLGADLSQMAVHWRQRWWTGSKGIFQPKTDSHESGEHCTQLHTPSQLCSLADTSESALSDFQTGSASSWQLILQAAACLSRLPAPACIQIPAAGTGSTQSAHFKLTIWPSLSHPFKYHFPG